MCQKNLVPGRRQNFFLPKLKNVGRAAQDVKKESNENKEQKENNENKEIQDNSSNVEKPKKKFMNFLKFKKESNTENSNNTNANPNPNNNYNSQTTSLYPQSNFRVMNKYMNRGTITLYFPTPRKFEHLNTDFLYSKKSVCNNCFIV